MQRQKEHRDSSAEADGTSVAQRGCVHAVQGCSSVVASGGQRKSTTKGASVMEGSLTCLSTIGQESFNCLLLGN